MSILPRLGIQQVAVLAASDGFAQVAEVSFVSMLFFCGFPWLCAFVHLWERLGIFVVTCH